uniref:UDENN domain-containing protein n=1 Tax=Onchocerca volvulus TaxID=6282 RepID=A0A8R1XUC9_ONCVO
MNDMDDMEAFDTPPWEKFGRWVYCICVVTFDLELGQSIEVVYPGDAQLTVNEKSSICYLSFPDSNCGMARDTNFHFRIRRSSGCSNLSTYAAYSERVPAAIDADPQYFYGFVHSRQKKDSSLPRGYFQKSLVLLTVLPLFDLFSLVVGVIAQGFFDSGEPAIEAACHHIDQWPIPIPGIVLCLPLMGNVIQCRIPCQIDLYSPQRNYLINVKLMSPSKNPVLLSIMNKSNILGSLLFVVNNVQLLWELVLTGEPVVVLAQNPSECSTFVQSLTSLIWPLRYSSDYRPFFTIHDAEFREYSSRTNPWPNVILGVTNPFFTKVFQNWPHIIRLVPSQEQQIPVGGKRKKIWNKRILETKYGLFSQYKMFLQKDKTLYKDALKANNSDWTDATELQRRILDLTQNFMMPLENYVSSLMPLKKHLSPFKNVPQIYPFVVDNFFSALDETRIMQTSGIRGDWRGLYQKFTTSLNFQDWLSRRKADLERQLRLLHLEMLCSADFSRETLHKRPQVEVVDLVLKLNDRIQNLDEASESSRIRLQSQISAILSSVDDDLKSVLLSNGSLRDCI